MADLSSFAQTVDNLGATVALLTDNFNKPKNGNGLGPRTVIVRVEHAAMTDAELNATLAFLTQASGVAGALAANTVDAFTVAGIAPVGGAGQFVSGTTADVYIALQGTGETANMKAGLELLDGVSTATVVADFDQRIVPA
jgi:hypothetical protein